MKGSERKPTPKVMRSPQIPKLLFSLSLGLALIVQGFPALTAGPPADDASLHTTVKRIESHLGQTRSLQADFTETVASVGGERRVRSGVVYYLKPRRIRWAFKGAQAETIVSDGNTVYTYQPDLNQVVETPASKAFSSQNAAAVLLDSKHLSKYFKITRPATALHSDMIGLMLTPLEGGTAVQVEVDPKTLNPKSFEFQDAIGDRTRLDLSNIKLNVPLDDSLFRFTPPPGADIVSGGPL